MVSLIDNRITEHFQNRLTRIAVLALTIVCMISTTMAFGIRQLPI